MPNTSRCDCQDLTFTLRAQAAARFLAGGFAALNCTDSPHISLTSQTSPDMESGKSAQGSPPLSNSRIKQQDWQDGLAGRPELIPIFCMLIHLVAGIDARTLVLNRSYGVLGTGKRHRT
jgi:hypothetical protein